jgi:hypothetical protein
MSGREDGESPWRRRGAIIDTIRRRSTGSVPPKCRCCSAPGAPFNRILINPTNQVGFVQYAIQPETGDLFHGIEPLLVEPVHVFSDWHAVIALRLPVRPWCRRSAGRIPFFRDRKCDVFELTLIVASARSGQSDYAGALRGQRVRRKPARADYPHRKPTFTIRFCGNVPK